MIDGTSDTAPTRLFDATQLTDGDAFDSKFPSAGVSPGDEVTVIFEDIRLGGWDDYNPQIFMLRINPALDDQNGDAADVSSITTLDSIPITSDSSMTSMRPSATVDVNGNAHVSYFGDYEEWGEDGPYGHLLFRVVGPSGNTLYGEKALTDNLSATSTTQLTLPCVALGGNKTFVTWTDNRWGNPEVLLRIIEP